MSQEVRQKVGFADVTRGLLSLAPDLGILTREGPGLLLRKPGARESIGLILQKVAASHPDEPFVKFEDSVLTYAEANATINRYARVLEAAGVQRGGVVGVMGHNETDTLLVILATVKLGAVAGLLNYNQRDEVLTHSLGILQSTVVVVGDDCVEGLNTATGLDGQATMTYSDLRGKAAGLDAADLPVTAEIQAHEKAFYIFTSGTTGLPKASIMSHFRWLKSYSGLGALGVRLKTGDTLYCCLPLYHNNAVTVALGAVLSGRAAFAIGRKFSVSRFWDEAISYDATAFVYIGELCRFLLSKDPSPQDRAHRIRVVVGNGLRPDIWKEFQERFGVKRIAEFYGASECNIAFINAFGIDETAGTCPLPYKVVRYDQETGKAARNDSGRLEKVKRGEVGLLLAKVTSRAPFDGYTDDDATEAKLLRDGFSDGDCWFDTGDLVLRQGHLHVAFVDRLGDTFRWKGENVATTQVEAIFEHLDWVEDCAVYGVGVPGTDGKAGMAAVVLKPGHEFDGVQAATVLKERLPGYAVPLFIRVVDSLEHTSTFKSRKVELRNQGFEGVDDPVYVLRDETDGYVPAYPEYAEQVAAGAVG